MIVETSRLRKKLEYKKLHRSKTEALQRLSKFLGSRIARMRQEPEILWRNRLIASILIAEEKIRKDTMPKPCNCHETVKKKIEEERGVELENESYAYFTGQGRMLPIMRFTIKKNGKPTKKTLSVTANFCPFCGRALQ